MRWFFLLLPMLCCLGTLTAQNPCSIANISAEVVNCNNGEFYVTLNFESSNVSPQGFTVASNGGVLGTFEYNELPVTLGPFEAGTGVFYGFIISDLVATTCTGVVGIGPVTSDCETLPCDDLAGLNVDVGDCNPDGTFKLTLSVDASPLPSNFSFEVFSGAGASLGTFPLSALPLTLDHYTSNGAAGTTDSIKVCLSELLNCCLVTEFEVPDCDTSNTSCSITDLTAVPGVCNADGSYPLTLDFNHASTSTNGTFTVYANSSSQPLGSFPLADLPLTIPSYPGGPGGLVKVCLDNVQNCCEQKQFQAPSCPPSGSDCEIFKVRVQRDSCTSDSTYTVKINFQVTNPDGDTFEVWANNGDSLGTFHLDSLPVTIANFPYDGGSIDRITICVGENCCVTRKIRVPDCLPGIGCDVYDLAVTTGDCTTDSTYNVQIDFNASGNDTDSVTVEIDGMAMGTFHADSLPISLTDVPWDGGNLAEVKVCFDANCCETKRFAVPDCLPGVSCEIFDLRVQTDSCNSDGSAYDVKINFEVANPDAGTFHVWGNNDEVDFGTFELSQLPLTIEDFPYEGGPTDNIRICLSNDCCVNRTFRVPDCVNDSACQIYDVRVRTGVCNPDGTYRMRVTFKTQNAVSDSFNITAGNGDVFGPFAISDLPAAIKFFPASGNAQDEITICLIDSTGGCCKTKKFDAPDCNGGNNCDISNLVADPGACNPDGSYNLVLNFTATGLDSTAKYEIFANGQSIGIHSIADLPFTVASFPNSGSTTGKLKICIVGQPNCCAEIEFQQPSCPSLCGIVDLVVDPGACNPDGTYNLVLNFGLQSPGVAVEFEVFGNNQSLGTFGLGDLPLTIANFPNDGNAVGVLKVCLVDLPNCCAITEFPQPDCPTTGNCEITDLSVDPGDCDPNGGTFSVFIAFSATVDSVDITGNGGSVSFGRFAVADSPIQIVNFPSTPGSTPTVEVCGADNPDCCKEVEFQAPDCPPIVCSITNLQALATPCISGQFFAVLTFDFTGGSALGYTVSGNGSTYGTFEYTGVQPLILGPLNGDGTTVYEFVVQDGTDQSCSAATELGTIDCQQIDPRSGVINGNAQGLAFSPNPVSDWLTVSAVLPAANGPANLQVFSADGRLVRTAIIADARAFGFDVSGLQPGLYRMSVSNAAGRVNGTFAKQ